MTKTKILLVTITLLLTSLSYGQQDPHYTQYMYNQNVLNPAYAGSRGDLSIGLLGRTQWVGIEGAPDTQTINIHGNLMNGLGVGLSAIRDEIGPILKTNVMLDLSYTMPVSDTGYLAFGIKGSYGTFNNNIGSMNNLVNQSDEYLNDDFNTSYPNIGAGFYYHTTKFYAGLAVPNLLDNYNYEQKSGVLVSDVSNKKHFFGTMGYLFDLGDNVKLKPSTMIKVVEGAPISWDLNASVFLNERFEVGLSWREGDSIDAILGLQVKPNFRIGYAYDHTLTPLGNYNSGSHELMLMFDLDFSRKNLKSPRYF